MVAAHLLQSGGFSRVPVAVITDSCCFRKCEMEMHGVIPSALWENSVLPYDSGVPDNRVEGKARTEVTLLDQEEPEAIMQHRLDEREP